MPPITTQNNNEKTLNTILDAISSVKSQIAIDNKEGHGKIYEKINELRIDVDRRIDILDKEFERDINMIEKDLITINHEIKVHENEINKLNEKIKVLSNSAKNPDEWFTSKMGQGAMWLIVLIISTLLSSIIKKFI